MIAVSISKICLWRLAPVAGGGCKVARLAPHHSGHQSAFKGAARGHTGLCLNPIALSFALWSLPGARTETYLIRRTLMLSLIS
jgi:hypothetical protein